MWKEKLYSFLDKFDNYFDSRKVMKISTVLVLVFIFLSFLPLFVYGKDSLSVSYGTDDRYRYEKWLPENYTRQLPKIEGTPENPPYTSVPLVTHNLVCIEGYAYYLISAYKMDKNGKIVLINNAIVPQYEYINGFPVPLICK